MKLLYTPLWIKVTLLSTATMSFLCTFIFDITVTNAEQFLSILTVTLLDGFFGVIAGVKREGFKTYKALNVLKTMFAWCFILFTILSIELAFKGTAWLSETIIVPFMVFQLISALKNASMAGFIQNDVLNKILDQIDNHKGMRHVDQGNIQRKK